MKISILTLFPEMFEPFTRHSILKRAQEKGAVEIEIINIREFAEDNYHTVDDRPYGGGAGMVLMVEPLAKALRSVIPEIDTAKHATKNRVLLTSPKGPHYNQQKARELAMMDHLVIIAGHYEGVDERIHAFVDEEVSLGDFVLTGGEIAAAAITDSVVRLLQGVLKKDSATEEESFYEVSVLELIKVVGPAVELVALRDRGVEFVQLLEYPHYTRPEEFEGKKVPEVLMGGNHKEIHTWRLQMAYKETLQKRPDLLR